MQRRPEERKIITDDQREAHEWTLLTRKLRRIGLNDSAARLERALAAPSHTADLEIADNHRSHGTRPAS